MSSLARYITTLLVALLGCCSAHAATGLSIVLDDAAGPDSDLEILLHADGKTGKAFASRLNSATHDVSIESLKQTNRSVELTCRIAVNSDGVVPGGSASFAVTLDKSGETFRGTHKGTFLGRNVEGNAATTAQPTMPYVLLLEPKLKSTDHPRLVFQRGELDTLKQRAKTPTGEAIMAMLTRRSPVRSAAQLTDRRVSWLAVNDGMLHQLAGDADAAARAPQMLIDEVVKKPLPNDRADFHHAMRLMGIALTYDLCCDAWDAGFREQMAEYLRHAMNELAAARHDGQMIDDLVVEPWSYRQAMRMSAVGLAALAIHGDRLPGGETIDAREQIDAARDAVAIYLQRGVGATGTGSEGRYFTDFALSNGVAAFMHGLKTATDVDLLAVVNPLVGHLLEADAAPGEDGRHDFGIASISLQLSGKWPIFADTSPALAWAADRSVGMKGAGHFDCAYPFQAGYALANWPDAPAMTHPSESLPALVADELQGRFVIRSRWQNADDALVVMNFGGGRHDGVELSKAEPVGLLRIRALGRTWIDDAVGLSFKGMNRRLGAAVTHVNANAGSRQLSITADLAPLYLKDITPRQRRRGRKDPSYPQPLVTDDMRAQPGVVTLPHIPGLYQATGVTGTRRMWVDLSGDSGASAVVVIHDKLTGAASHTWRLPIDGMRWRDRTFAVAADNATLTGYVITDDKTRPRKAGISGGNDYLVVLTIHRGDAPVVAVDDGVLTIGKQRLRIDAEHLSLDVR